MMEKEYPEDEIFEDEESHIEGWLCTCGNYIEDGCHCSFCYQEPPWGCPCSWCQGDRYYEDEDEDLLGVFDYP